jgi:glycosyltransferase involved in cell wall biosynthesis
MTLVDLSHLQWRAGRMKRNLALFTHLLRGAALDRGIYINLSWTAHESVRDYFAVPIVETLTTYAVGDAPVIVLRPKNALPLSYRTETFARLSGSLFARKIRGLMAGDRYILWVNGIVPVECGMAAALARRAEMVVLDNSDDLPTLEPPELRQSAERRLQRMLRLADKTLCVNEHVFSKIQHPCKLLFRNCTTFDSLQKTIPDFRLPPWFPKPAGRTYIGFIGSLHEDRVDAGLLEYLISAFPQFTFLFVGWVSEGLIGTLAKYPNAQIVPEAPNDVLGTVIRSFDAAIIPHRDNAITKGNDLLKLLDYNACAVPVVTTPVSGTGAGYTALIASTKQDFADCVRACVEGNHNLNLAQGVEYARERSWETQVPKLIDWLGLGRR